MTWVRIDDGYHRNAKVRAAGLHARALHLAGLCWTAANLKDGHIPRSVIGLIAAEAEVKASTAARLVEVGLWHTTDDGWVINDFLEFNRPAEAIMAERRAAAERQRRGRLTQAQRRAEDDGVTDMSRRDSRRDNTVSHGGPVPTRPDPTPVSKSLPPPEVCTGQADPVAVVIELLADAALASEATPPRRPDAWRKAVTERLHRELGTTIAQDLEHMAHDAIAVAQLHAEPVNVRIAARNRGLL